jgi:hypothetical protein
MKSESLPVTYAPNRPASATMYGSASPSASSSLTSSPKDRRAETMAGYPRVGAMRVSASDRGVERAAADVRKKRLACLTQLFCRRETKVGYLSGGVGPRTDQSNDNEPNMWNTYRQIQMWVGGQPVSKQTLHFPHVEPMRHFLLHRPMAPLNCRTPRR